MRLRFRFATSRFLALPGLTLAAALALPGCDNPACVFGGDCDGDGPSGAVGELPATVPIVGEWIVSAAPEIDAVFPDEDLADPGSPIVFVFSESMSPDGLATAFELRPLIGTPTQLSNVALVGDGRVLVAIPPAPLTLNTLYTVHFTQDASLADRTGQELEIPENGIAGSFRTATTAPTAPRVVATWPPDGATAQSALGEIVVVFSRLMQTSSFTDTSFDVLVEGVDPVPDIAPDAGELENGASDTRIWIYHRLDLLDMPVPLGAASSDVEVTLSPSGQTIRDSGGTALATTAFEFTLAPFDAPTSAALVSDPSDAIGIAQITGAANLAIDVGLSGTQAGDFLRVMMFGVEPGKDAEPGLIALEREVALPSNAPTITLAAADLDLVRTTSPLEARFADGEIYFAFQVRRGSTLSPVRLLDIDAGAEGTQGPILDTEAPTLLGLSTSGNVVSSFRSDQRDLVLIGRATEELRAVRVTTDESETNVLPGGIDPPAVAGSTSAGLFVAAPVPIGVLPQGDFRTYSITVFDRALNASGTATGEFTQVGASVLGNPLPAGDISVQVYDATTLSPIASARVLTHENVANFVVAVPGGDVTTDASGFALVPAGLDAFGQTILTVDANGYDLFTFDGVPTDEISVPLTPTVLADGELLGEVTSDDDDLAFFTLGTFDSRATAMGTPLFPVGTCSSGDEFAVACPYSAIPIAPRIVGAVSAIVFDEPTSAFQYSHLTFFKGFGLTMPAVPALPGAQSATHVEVAQVLEGAEVDPEDLAIDVPAQSFASANFVFDPLEDRPRVRVEAIAPGIPGSLAIGRGVAFGTGSNAWLIRAAMPGAADGFQDVPDDALGSLVTNRSIDPDPFLRIDVVDDGGNVGTSRRRMSLLAGAPSPLTALDPPALLGTILNGGGVSFDLGVQDTLPDAAAMAGLYRARLTDSTGRSWTLFRVDLPDAVGGVVRLHVPYIGAGNTFPLASGSITARATVFAWSSLDVQAFMWSDLGREEELTSTAAASTFVPPDPP